MPEPQNLLKPGSFPRAAIGRIGLWLAGSALIGSAALVLWNRRALKRLQNAASEPLDVRSRRDDDGIY
jgi:hypothetical protein